MPTKNILFALLFSAFAGLTLTSCGLRPLPSDLPVYSTQEQVVKALGYPQFTAWSRVPSVPVVWGYRDEWHRNPPTGRKIPWWEQMEHSWSPSMTTTWGSWDVYFDTNKRFVGWRIAEPAPTVESAREALWTQPPPEAVARAGAATAPRARHARK